MLKYIDIAVDLKLHRHAKDGLHQYRNISQQQAPQSLEAIIQHLLKAGDAIQDMHFMLQKEVVGMSRARDIDAHACTHEVARPHVAIMRRLP